MLTPPMIKKTAQNKNKPSDSESELKELLDMPLFSKRKAIADLCEKWCKQHHVPTHPQNIILAALKMNLLQIKEHV